MNRSSARNAGVATALNICSMNPKGDPQQAMYELLKRKRSQSSLHSFALNIDIPGAPMTALCPDEDLLGPASGSNLMADHHSLMLSHIERTMNMPFGRLMDCSLLRHRRRVAIDPGFAGYDSQGYRTAK